MDYTSWLKDGELTDEAFDQALELYDKATEEGVDAVKPTVDKMPPAVRQAVADVFRGLDYGAALMVTQPEN